MLTSTKRRVLNVICVTLAVASVAYGLVLRYEKSSLEAVVVQENELKLEDETLEADPALVLRANNPFTNPNN